MEELIDIYGTSIYSFCCYLTGSVQSADDLYQNLLLKALEKREKLMVPEEKDLQKKYAQPKNYLLGIGIRLWKKEKTKQTTKIPMISLDDEESGVYQTLTDGRNVEERIEESEVIEALHHIVAGLPEKWRVVILLFYTGEMKIDEIAKELKIPKGTVKSRLYHARLQIRKEMEGRGYEI